MSAALSKRSPKKMLLPKVQRSVLKTCQFLAIIPFGSRYSIVPNELIHRAGLPFLDNHYRGYPRTNHFGGNFILPYSNSK